MRLEQNSLHLSATDLAKFLGCRHLTQLDRAVAEGRGERPAYYADPSAELLRERGLAHERAYVEYLRSSGRSVVELRDVDGSTALERTATAMREGAGVIVQASLAGGRWGGRADLLVRVDEASSLGAWSYEVVDTKLAQDTRGGTVLQLCLYSDLVADLQGRAPSQMYVVKPGEGFPREAFRFADFRAYYRLVRRRLEAETDASVGLSTYPEPVEQCDWCDWWRTCDRKRHDDDHLSLVAGIQTHQIKELQSQGIRTLRAFADRAERGIAKPERGSLESLQRAHGQARVQLEGRRRGAPVYELLPPQPDRGFHRLPVPTAGDVFFDIEGDPFVEGGGLEFLFGFVFANDTGELEYRKIWATNPSEEKRAFETFVDFVFERLKAFPDLHIYHFAPYEPSALKRLMGRHATREREIDWLLRAERFVDLYAVTRQGLRASVERYSLKDLEPFFGFRRETDLRAASAALRRAGFQLELGEGEDISCADRETVEGYNREDCLAAAALRNWLEERREEAIRAGRDIERRPIKTGEASDNVREGDEEIREVYEALIGSLPENREEWGPAERATWLLAHQLEYFRREDKCAWWEFFHLRDLPDDDLLEERKAIAHLTFDCEVEGGSKTRSTFHRYRFPPQEVGLEEGAEVHEAGGEKVGNVSAIDVVEGWVVIRKSKVDRHPRSVVARERVDAKLIANSLLEIGRWVAENGIDSDGPYRAARDLLLNLPPRTATERRGASLRGDEEDAVPALARLSSKLDGGALPVQGPPGTGKTYAGARMIVALARNGKRVGVTAVSHKVIRKLLDESLKAAKELGASVEAVHKVGETGEHAGSGVVETTNNAQALAAVADGAVVGGTAWLWSRDDAVESLDYLVVDEAGQMALAFVLGAARSARNVVLLGDPQQLEQPQRGAHPEGAEVAALKHVLGEAETLPADKGLFLDETWRLAPNICSFTSELFYEDRLEARKGLERQVLKGSTRFAGSGLYYVPVEHARNQNHSPEEVEAIERIVTALVAEGVEWVNADGIGNPLRPKHVLVVAPYNAQVSALRERLPTVSVGTVDKFQGQEAPVVIYSLASSSPQDAPRGLSFLYSPNRLNVATSRARCACILVATPALFEAECRTPEQMRWVNAMCRYREMATEVAI